MPATDERWKARFRAPRPVWSQIAHLAPNRGIVWGDYSGSYQLHAWNVSSGELRQLTSRSNGVGYTFGTLNPKGTFVYYHEDDGGNEIGHFVRIPYEGGAASDVTPQLPPYASLTGIQASRDGRRLGFVAASAGKFALYTLDAAANGAQLGEPRKVAESSKMIGNEALSYDGGLAAISSAEKSQGLALCLTSYDLNRGTKIAELWDGEHSSLTAGPFAPVRGDTRMLATSDRSGTTRPLIWNPPSGARVDLDFPELDGDVFPILWSPDATQIVLLNVSNALEQLYFYDISVRTLARAELSGGTYWPSYFTGGGELLVHWQDSRRPTHVIALDGRTGAKLRTVLPGGPVPDSRDWRSVTFPSSGYWIQGWLATPEGSGPFPTILETHGGPQAAMLDIYSPAAQAWLDHGFAYLTINYRGSVTFGREFERSIWGNPGRVEIEDMVAARDYLISCGVARPESIFLTGWSYGGYLTLLALGKTPELWAGGMAGIGIADWKLMYEDSADTLRGYQRALFAGGPDEKPEQYIESSPITYVDRIRRPILIMQGLNDTRCPRRQMEEFIAKLGALDKRFEVRWFDAGHGSLVTEQTIEHHALMIDFAERVLAER